MNFIFKMIVAAAMAYGAYWAYEQYEARKAAEASLAAAKQKPVIEEPERKFTRIECRTCNGVGKLVDSSGAIQVSYRCSVCDGRGHKNLPAHVTLCPHCDGIGGVARSARTDDKRILGQRCPICSGSGVKPVL